MDSVKGVVMEVLVQLLTECEALLRKVDELFWADKIRHTLKKGNRALDLYSLEDILSWYGGMGSFNDLIISTHNDHLVDDKDEDEINKKLSSLRSKIYQEALRLQRQM